MLLKPFEKLEFTDDYMFKKVMKNEEICKGVIERLLHIEVGKIEFPEIEKEISPYYTSHGVRLDVHVKDSNRIFDIEMQSYKQDALGKRCRYYQSMVDIDALMKGEDYSSLKESFILFICTENPFSDFNLPVYTFKNICLEDSKVPLDDKSVKVIYNAAAYEEEKDENLRSFLKFVRNLNADDAFTTNISNLVTEIKRSEANKMEYIGMNLHDRDLIMLARKEGREEGEQAGARQNAIANATNLLKMNVITQEQIAQATGLKLAEVQKLAEELGK
ncbi:MAG: Rpn family recombination-promoting nuclease/putative transposase [Treponema sp.]|nr:Rpn family recombination-promoting nuclease/putative transposase [Treponema sp.]